MLRTRLALERPWPWVMSSTISCLFIVLLGVLVLSGTVSDPWGNHLRGYTVTGTLLGGVAVLLGSLSFLYALRKRALQERLATSGSMMAWLGLHVALGVMAMVAALVHAGFGTISPVWSTGKVLLIAFGVLTLSGIVWRIVYRVVPPRATETVGNYSEAASLAHARAQETEIDKAMAGGSEGFIALARRVRAHPEETPAGRDTLSPREQMSLEHITELAKSRDRSFDRARRQRRYARLLQLWRILHVPAALAIPVLLTAHVVGALRLVERALPMGSAPRADLAGFAPSRACRDCHRAIYEQWKHSMHAHAMNSPVMIAQSNQVVREELADDDTPDPRLLCINCHGPVGVALTGQSEEVLPLARDGYDPRLLNEGIGCVGCHQLEGEPVEGRAGLAVFQGDLRLPGDTYLGPLSDPVGNAYHQSATSSLWERSETLCRNCHNVVYDLDDDGEIREGVDLILQRTTQEYDAYRDAGGEQSCLACHMPIVEGVTRTAEHALMWLDQDGAAPDRVVHDHAFVGVDHPLDVAPDDDPQRKKRERLLKSAATLTATVADGKLTVTITNSGTGHNLPTGLAFARQLWLEVTVRDDADTTVFSSGRVAKVTDDLCDANTLTETHLAPHMRGCDAGPDPSLVNFQQKLIDRIEPRQDGVVAAADGAKESVLQRIRGGVVPRVRPADEQKQTPMVPNASRTFAYTLPDGAQTISVRLLFRSFAPYFLRAVAAGQPAGEKPRLAPLVANLQIAEMARVTVKP